MINANQSPWFDGRSPNIFGSCPLVPHPFEACADPVTPSINRTGPQHFLRHERIGVGSGRGADSWDWFPFQ